LNRRTLMALMAGAILTPDGLWTPGAKKIFLPPRRRLVATWTLITVAQVEAELEGILKTLNSVQSEQGGQAWIRDTFERLPYVV
jgi:hypothetical protein